MRVRGRTVSLCARIVFCLTACGAALAQQPGAVRPTATPCPPANEKPADKVPDDPAFYEDMAMPEGRWSVSVRQDTEPLLAEGTPVTITFLGMVTAKGRHGGVKVNRAAFCNHAGRGVSSLRLRWMIVREEDYRAVLLEGETAPFEARVPAGKKLYAEIPVINVAEAIRPLAAGGALEGKFMLRVRVGEARFDDSTTWRDRD